MASTSPDAEIVQLHDQRQRVERKLRDRRRAAGYVAVHHHQAHEWGRPPVEAIYPDAVVIVVLAGPGPGWAS